MKILILLALKKMMKKRHFNQKMWECGNVEVLPIISQIFFCENFFDVFPHFHIPTFFIDYLKHFSNIKHTN